MATHVCTHTHTHTYAYAYAYAYTYTYTYTLTKLTIVLKGDTYPNKYPSKPHLTVTLVGGRGILSIPLIINN